MYRYMCVRYMRLFLYYIFIFGICRIADRLIPPRNFATVIALSYFRFYNSPGRILWHGHASAHNVLRMQHSALHSLTHLYNTKEITDKDPFRVVKSPNQSRAGYARRESQCQSNVIQIKTKQNLNFLFVINIKDQIYTSLITFHWVRCYLPSKIKFAELIFQIDRSCFPLPNESYN